MNRLESGGHEGGMQTRWARPWCALCWEGTFRKPTLKPYWGKPAVRNFRGDDGNVGIIRSPVRAIALPDIGEHLLIEVIRVVEEDLGVGDAVVGLDD
jgi:hypothetical protein